ncbi:MAG TPA: fibronectin type III domain-containing protein [Gemmatimonadaceae bacterium]|nr:fibronectin type III domain-containing protein [Gemmatimonadaceae bacterium]
MLFSGRKLSALTLAMATFALAACSSDDDPTENTVPPVLGAQAGPNPAATTSSIIVTFQSRAGDNSFNIERAEGATGGTFAPVGTVQAPAAPGAVSYTDNGLKLNTTYQYRVFAVRGSKTSSASSVFTATTQAPGTGGNVDVSQDITTSTTWTNDKTYTLKGFIHVANGATLTIQPGTRIMGDFNTLGSSLFILRGAKINAVGTADAPIVFTSSRAAGQRQPGDWGGLIIIGNARINRSGTVQIEGSGTVTGSTSATNYPVSYSGGMADDDNSGTLSYVRVEFAGFAPATDQELNSFTFAAVGSGTRVSYVQSMAGLDDSFEFFGGGLVGDHLVSYEAGDDHFDMSEGFRGKLQYLIALQTTQLTPRTGAGSVAVDPEGIENDGCNGSGCDLGFNSAPFTVPVIANFTLVGTGDVASSGASGGLGMMLRRGTGGYYVNGLVARYPRGGVSLRDADTYTRAGATAITDLATADLGIKNVLFSENGTVFQGANGSNVQNSLDLAGNALVSSTTATTALFTAFPAVVSGATIASAFDWTPAATSPIATGGLATFTGKLATAAGTTVTGTSYVGAAQPTGAKWWAGWTIYARN